jgi:hypothetical protein
LGVVIVLLQFIFNYQRLLGLQLPSENKNAENPLAIL